MLYSPLLAFSFAVLFCYFLMGGRYVSAEEIKTSPVRNLTGFENVNEQQPLWELGAGAAAFDVPNYPASNERNFIALAAPYIVYRGSILRFSTNNGVRAVVVEKSNVEFDISFDGAFAADSEDNTARAGMPELDYMFEVGPQVIYRIKDFTFKRGGNARLRSRIQARAVFSSDFKHIEQRGYIIEPTLSYQQRGVFFKDTALNITASANFATEDLHDYFYQVDSQYVTEQRPYYDAKGGYLGSELSLSYSFPVNKNLRVTLGGTVDINTGAANTDSPLYENDITYSYGIGAIWRIYTSKTMANW